MPKKKKKHYNYKSKTHLLYIRHQLSRRPPKRPRRRRPKLIDSKLDSKLEERVLILIREHISHVPTLQHEFHPHRQWRFDFAWPDFKVAIEVQGFGTGHTSRDGMFRDYEKHNAAQELGWRIIYLMSQHLEDEKVEETVLTIRKALNINDNFIKKNTWTDKVADLRKRLDQGFDS